MISIFSPVYNATAADAVMMGPSFQPRSAVHLADNIKPSWNQPLTMNEKAHHNREVKVYLISALGC